MAGFTKLFSSIVTSSVWTQEDATLRVWIAMLAMVDSEGVVEGSVPGFASLARVSIPAMENALKVLSSPDPYSRSKDFEGRRIEAFEGGWRILNYATYRERAQGKEGSKAPHMRRLRERRRQEGPATEAGNALPPGVTRYPEERREKREERDTDKRSNVEPEARPVPPEDGPGQMNLTPVAASRVLAQDVMAIFTYWQKVCNHPHAKLLAERDRRIRARLKEGYDVPFIKRAIDGCAGSSFHRGGNESETVYNDITLICRSGSKLEWFADMAMDRKPGAPRDPVADEKKAAEERRLADLRAKLQASRKAG